MLIGITNLEYLEISISSEASLYLLLNKLPHLRTLKIDYSVLNFNYWDSEMIYAQKLE